MSRSHTPHVKDTFAYCKAIVSKEISACTWTILACQRHLDDLERSKSKEFPYLFASHLAEERCELATLMPHTKGKWANQGQRFKLEAWESFIFCSLFGWVHKKTRLRRFREAYIEVPRKSGKSFLAAVIGLIFFAADNEFGAEVYSGATTEKQAWEIFRPALLMAQRSKDFRDTFGINPLATSLTIPSTGSRFLPVIGSPGDGASPSCALIDEYHEHRTDTLYETMTTGMGAREQPLTVIVTTAGGNLASPCYAKHLDVKKVLQKIHEDERLFGLIYSIDDDDDWTAESSLLKANPNYDVSVSAEFLRDRQLAAMRSARLQNSFKTKHLNLWVGAYAAWLNMLEWRQAPPRKPLDELKSRPCFVGLDLSSTRDISAWVAVFPPAGDDPLYHLHGRYYLPEDVILEGAGNASHYRAWEKQGFLTVTPGTTIDYEQIKDDIIAFVKEYEVLRLPFDDWNAIPFFGTLKAEPEFAERRVWNTAEKKWEMQSRLVNFPQTPKFFSDPMKQFEAAVLNRKIAHGDDPVLTWFFSNLVVREDKNENIFPVKEAPESKIDGAVAVLMAFARSLVERITSGSIYERREVAMI